MIGSGAAVGVEASHRLARLGTVHIQPGLTEAELDGVERRFGFQFSDDHRTFLAAGLPVFTAGQDDHPDKASWGWPNRRDHESEDLRRQVEWPTQCVLSVVRDGGWPTGWGKRPSNPDEVEAKTRRLLATVPRMVPVYAHRYLPGGQHPGTPSFPSIRCSTSSSTASTWPTT